MTSFCGSGNDPDDMWACVVDGGISHLVLPNQLLTDQAALCGYQPPDDARWYLTEGSCPRPTSGFCKKCDPTGKAAPR